MGDSTATDEPEGFFIMKKCNKCGEVKPFEKFYKNKSIKNGIDSYCKVCSSEMCKNRRRSLYGKAERIFTKQKQSSKIRGHHPPLYTKDEFIDWILRNEDYLRLHNQWVDSGYKKSLAPSVDRINDYKGYSFDNIQVTTWGENERKGHSDRKNGINNKHSKAVVKCDLNGVELDSYHSISNAEKKTGIEKSSICRACNGRYKTAGGFKWRYVDA